MMSQSSYLSSLVMLYQLLNGIIIVMFFIHLIHYIGFQKRLSVIYGTLYLMLPDMSHLLIVVAIIGVMTSFIMYLVSGYRAPQIATLNEALFTYFKVSMIYLQIPGETFSTLSHTSFFLLQYLITSDDSKLFEDLRKGGLAISAQERGVVNLIWFFSVFMFIFVLRSFFIVVIMVS